MKKYPAHLLVADYTDRIFYTMEEKRIENDINKESKLSPKLKITNN